MKLLTYIFCLFPLLSFGQLYELSKAPGFGNGSPVQAVTENEVIYRTSDHWRIGVLKKTGLKKWKHAYYLEDPIKELDRFGWGDPYRVFDSMLVIPSPDSCLILVYKKQNGIWELDQKLNYENRIGTCNMWGTFDFDGTTLAVLNTVDRKNMFVRLYRVNKNERLVFKEDIAFKHMITHAMMYNDFLVTRSVKNILKPKLIIYKKTNNVWAATDSTGDAADSSRYFARDIRVRADQLLVGTSDVSNFPNGSVVPNLKVYEIDINGKLILKQRIFNEKKPYTNFFAAAFDSDGETLVIGSPQEVVDGLSRTGWLFVYKKDMARNWDLIDTIKPDLNQSGWSITVNKDLLVSGSRQSNSLIFQQYGSVSYSQLNLCDEFSSIQDLEKLSNYHKPSISLIDTFTNTNLYDSIVKTKIDTTKPTLSVLLQGNMVVADTGFTNYRWVNCATNDTFTTNIPNQFETTSSIKVKSVANYNNCVLSSSCVDYVLTDVDWSRNEIKLYPNPAQDFISVKGIDDVSFLSVYNFNGHKIIDLKKPWPNKPLDISNLSNGYYFIKIRTATDEQYFNKIIISR